MNPLTMNPWYKSHKFWGTAIAELLLIVSVMTGKATMPEIIAPAITLLLGYFGIRVAETAVKKPATPATVEPVTIIPAAPVDTPPDVPTTPAQ